MVRNSAVNYTDDTKKALIAYDIPAIDHLTNRYCVELELDSSILVDVQFKDIYSGILGCMDFFIGLMNVENPPKSMKEFNEIVMGSGKALSKEEAELREKYIDQYGKWVILINTMYEEFINKDQTQLKTIQTLTESNLSPNFKFGFRLYAHSGNAIQYAVDPSGIKYLNSSKGFNEVERFVQESKGVWVDSPHLRDYLIVMTNLRPLLQFNVKVRQSDDSKILYLQWDITEKMFFDEDIIFNPNFTEMNKILNMPADTQAQIDDMNTKWNEILPYVLFPKDEIVSFTKKARKERQSPQKTIAAPFIAINSLISGARANFSRNLRSDSKFKNVNRSVFMVPPEFALAPNFEEKGVYSFRNDLPSPYYKYILDSGTNNHRFIQKNAPRDIEEGDTFEEILIRNYYPAYSILKYYASEAWFKIIEEHNDAILNKKEYDLLADNYGDDLWKLRPRFLKLASVLKRNFNEFYAIIQVRADKESIGELIEFMTGQSMVNSTIKTLEEKTKKIATDIQLVNTPIVDKNGSPKLDKNGNTMMRVADPKSFRDRMDKILKDYHNLIRSNVIYAIPATEQGYLQAKELLKFRFDLIGQTKTDVEINNIIIDLKKQIDSASICVDFDAIKQEDYVKYFKYSISVIALFQLANLAVDIERFEPLVLMFQRLMFERTLYQAYDLIIKMETGVDSPCVAHIPTKAPKVKKGKKSSASKKSSKPKKDEKEAEKKAEVKPKKSSASKKSSKPKKEEKEAEKKAEVKPKKSSKPKKEEKEAEKNAEVKPKKSSASKKSSKPKKEEKEAEVKPKKDAEPKAEKKISKAEQKKIDAEQERIEKEARKEISVDEELAKALLQDNLQNIFDFHCQNYHHDLLQNLKIGVRVSNLGNFLMGLEGEISWNLILIPEAKDFTDIDIKNEIASLWSTNKLSNLEIWRIWSPNGIWDEFEIKKEITKDQVLLIKFTSKSDEAILKKEYYQKRFIPNWNKIINELEEIYLNLTKKIEEDTLAELGTLLEKQEGTAPEEKSSEISDEARAKQIDEDIDILQSLLDDQK